MFDYLGCTPRSGITGSTRSSFLFFLIMARASGYAVVEKLPLEMKITALAGVAHLVGVSSHNQRVARSILGSVRTGGT